MRILVTAGNTLVPIDRVRCLTNVFTGRTGARIALHAFLAGPGVQLLTSHSEGVFAPAPGTELRADNTWGSEDGAPPRLLDRSAGKVKSDEPELWLRLVRAPKLVDKVRADWNFRGILVKFKLEVGLGPDQLL